MKENQKKKKQKEVISITLLDQIISGNLKDTEKTEEIRNLFLQQQSKIQKMEEKVKKTEKDNENRIFEIHNRKFKTLF